MRCPKCGREVGDDAGFCPSCGTSLVRVEFYRPAEGVPLRHCVSCGRSLPWEANVCPYCGHDYRIPANGQYSQTQPQYSVGIRVVFYVLSFLFWIAGVIIGLVLYTRPDAESKHVGKICLVLGCIGISVSIIMAFVLYLMVLGFGG